jgi:hypothetical protein
MKMDKNADRNDARAVFLYHQLQGKAKAFGLSLDTNNTSIGILRNENLLGFFISVDEVSAFLSGYEIAKNSLDKSKT